MDQFIDLPEEPGFDLHSKCRNCSEVILTTPEAKAAHKCPPTAEEEREINYRKDLADMNRQLQEAKEPKEIMRIFEMIERCEQFYFEEQLLKLERKFPQEVMRGIIYRAILHSIEHVRKYRDREYIKQDELRAKGVPYAVRIKELDTRRLEFCDKKEAQLLHDIRHFRVRPIRDWLTLVDLEWARKRGEGMEWLVRFYLENTYWVPQSNNKKQS